MNISVINAIRIISFALICTGLTAIPVNAQTSITTNDLLAIDHPIYLVEAGNWAIFSKALLSDDTAAGRMAFPYYPPANYDFIVEFMTTRSDANIAFLLSQGNVPFAWSLNTSGGNARLEDYNGHSIIGNPNIRYYPISAFTLYKAEMKIRTNSVTCLINDAIVQEEYQTDYSELSRNSKWQMADNRLLGIGGYSGFINHIISAKVIEYGNSGTWLTNEYIYYPDELPDFEYKFVDALDSTAEQYVVSKVNIQARSEGSSIKYYCPVNNNQDSSITYRYDFNTPIKSAFLQCNLYAVNFGSSYGQGSLWGSTNGIDWIQIMDRPTPVFDGSTGYEADLPSTLTGGTSLWLQARMLTVGWNITAQWLRSQSRPYVFELTACLKKPEISFKRALVAELNNLEQNQSYTIQSSDNLKTWYSIEQVIASNATVTHTQTWIIDEFTRPVGFFRLSGSGALPAASGW